MSLPVFISLLLLSYPSFKSQTCQQLLWPLPSPLVAFRAKGKILVTDFFPHKPVCWQRAQQRSVFPGMFLPELPISVTQALHPRDPPCSEIQEEKAQVVLWKPLESCLAYPPSQCYSPTVNLSTTGWCQQHYRESNLGGS